MDFKTLVPKNGVKPTSMVILLHGYGSNGDDLISLAPYMQSALPDTIFISPNAPHPCEGNPYGGFQWFSLAEYTPEKLYEGTKAAAPILTDFIQEQAKAYDLCPDKVALLGFSQGTMMALYAGLHYPEKLAGILGYSGALTGEGDLPTADNTPPIYLIHGEADSVVPVAAYHHATQALTEKGFRVDGHTTPHLEHSIDEEGITKGIAFLAQNL